MDFYNLFKKKTSDKKTQLEDYFTELVAFMCNVSDEFKEIYFKDFLKLTKIVSKDYFVKTQDRKPEKDETLTSIPDFILKRKVREKDYCVCEHKIDSLDFENQLEKYAEYGQIRKIIVPRIYPIDQSEVDKFPGKWKLLHWETLFDLLYNYDSSKETKINKFFDYYDFNDFVKKNPKASEYSKILYLFMEFMYIQDLYNLSLEYEDSYTSIKDILKNVSKLKKFYEYKKLIKKVNDGKGNGSYLEKFVSNGVIWTRTDKYDGYSYITAFSDYENIDEFCIQKEKDRFFCPLDDFDLSKETGKSAKEFNKQYKITYEKLKHLNDLIHKCINAAKLMLKKINTEYSIDFKIPSKNSEDCCIEYKIIRKLEKESEEYFLVVEKDKVSIKHGSKEHFLDESIFEMGLDDGINNIAKFIYNIIKA